MLKSKFEKIPEVELWEKYEKTKDKEIKDFFICKYAPLVKFVAHKIAIGFPEKVEFEDIVSYGTFGLIDAIDKFSVKKNIKFKTYAVSRIRGAILDELRKIDILPRSVRQKIKKLEAAISELETTLGRTPTDEEIANKLGISQEELGDLLTEVSGNVVLSLSDTYFMGSDDEETQLGDTLKAPEKDSPDVIAQKQETKQIIADAIKSLPEKELQVLALYYYENLTLKEIGEVMEITESRVSQIHTKALLRLRSHPKILQLRSQLFKKS